MADVAAATAAAAVPNVQIPAGRGRPLVRNIVRSRSGSREGGEQAPHGAGRDRSGSQERREQEPRVDNGGRRPEDAEEPRGPDEARRGVNLEAVRRQTERVIQDVRDFVTDYEEHRIDNVILEHIRTGAARLTERVDECAARLEEYEELGDLELELHRADRLLKRFVLRVTQRYRPPPPPPNPRDVSPETLDIRRRDVEFYMNQLNNGFMPDVGLGSDAGNAQVRDCYDVNRPHVAKAIENLRVALSTYMIAERYDRDLARDAQEKCEEASLWLTELTFRHRQLQLHLDKNVLHNEITFSAYSPNGEVSIYEFFVRFESWAEGYLSEEAKADQLYHKYLHPDIIQSYDELTPLKEDFRGMKKWLIKKFGSVIPMANGQLKAIQRLGVPKDSDKPGMIQYLRSIHRIISNLQGLEVSKGVPVPKLAAYLGSNIFLTSLLAILPEKIRTEFNKKLVRTGVEDTDDIEGEDYLEIILRIIRMSFKELELDVKTGPATASEPPSTKEDPPSLSQPTGGGGTGAFVANFGFQNMAANSGPPLSGANTTPLGNGRNRALGQNGGGNQQQSHVNRSYQQQNSSSSGNQQQNCGNGGHQQQNCNYSNGNQRQNQQQWDRWSCPIRSHRDHNIMNCTEFWQLTPKKRRFLCKNAGCYTCFDRDKNCVPVCARYGKVPPELVCPECASAAAPGASAPSILFCSNNQHTKRSQQELVESLEAWIPGLDINTLGVDLRVNVASLTAYRSATSAPCPQNKTRKAPACPSRKVFDTITGASRVLDKKTVLNAPSQDAAFYVMQTIRMGDEEVILFFDSGANGNLIEGELAEKLDLDVVSNNSVVIGSLGGGQVWAEYGQYALTLGPDMNGGYHQLELQGIQTITNTIPAVNLEELWDDADQALGGSRILPRRIGGDRVKILLGIKNTMLNPRILLTLPNGLGIYESMFYDIYQSNICFGGPHTVFTEAYRRVGLASSHVQVLLNESFRAYLRTPWTFVADSEDNHGPPCHSARALELVEDHHDGLEIVKGGDLDANKRVENKPTETKEELKQSHSEGKTSFEEHLWGPPNLAKLTSKRSFACTVLIIACMLIPPTNNVPIARSGMPAATVSGSDFTTSNYPLLGWQWQEPTTIYIHPKAQLERDLLLTETWHKKFINSIHCLRPQPLHEVQAPPEADDVVLFDHTNSSPVWLQVQRQGVVAKQQSRPAFEIRHIAPDEWTSTPVWSAAQKPVTVPAGELGPSSKGFQSSCQQRPNS